MALTEVPIELSSTPGIVDNSTGTAITIDASGNVDVTGTVTADGLTVDGNATIQGASSPTLTITDSDTPTSAFVSATNSSTRFGSSTNTDVFLMSNNTLRVQIDGPTGDISFYEDTGTTAKLFWDASAESLGIGTTSPGSLFTGANKLVIGDGSGENGMTIYSGTATDGNIYFADGTTGADAYRGYLEYSHSSNYFRIGVDGSEAMRIDASGVVKLITANDTAGTEKFLTFGTNSFNRAGIKCTNAGTYDGSLEFYTGNSTNFAERMRLDASGNVGIMKTPEATNSNYRSLEVGLANLMGRTGGTDWYLSSNAYYSDAWRYTTASNASQYVQTGGEHFWKNATGTPAADGTVNNTGTWTEQMKLDSSGNLLVGTTTPNTTATLYAEGSSSNAFGFAADKDASSAGAAAFSRPDDGLVINFYRAWAGGGVGNISITSTATAYNTSSDQRLKENIVDAPSASDDIDAIQVRSFDWKADGSHQKYGMVAQELVTVAPEAVTQPEDPEEMMSVDYSKLVPMMLKEIQQLRARVAQLEGAN